MKTENVSLLLDTFVRAGHLQAQLPKLPEGMRPSYVRVIHQLWELQKTKERVCVSDLSEMLDVSRPGITAALKALEPMGYVVKTPDEKDGRSILVRLTPKGEWLYHMYVENMHESLAQHAFGWLSDEEVVQLAGLCQRISDSVRQFSDEWEAVPYDNTAADPGEPQNRHDAGCITDQAI